MARQQTIRLRSLTIRHCGNCQAVIPWHMAADARYCSTACQQAAWYRRNDEMLKQRAVEWNAANAEQKSAIGKLYYRNNRERAQMQNAAWRAANPEKAREISRNTSARRRARLRGVTVEDFSLAEIWERDEGICWLCEATIDPLISWPDPKSMSLEHKVPISLGGGHTRANCALAHLGCNLLKGSKLITEAQEFQVLLTEAAAEATAEDIDLTLECSQPEALEQLEFSLWPSQGTIESVMTIS
ncbi:MULTISPECIES: HNH endonuclease [Paenarthrobacter]|nr:MULTISPECIES: HNH endonuclease [Paenarthrobacter]MDO5863415.1 HNH endonuclease [Paenarthrobacter sp. SD-2]